MESKRKEAERLGQEFKTKTSFSCICTLCKQSKTKEFGHSCFHSKKSKTMFHFCQTAAGARSVEDWLQEKSWVEGELCGVLNLRGSMGGSTKGGGLKTSLLILTWRGTQQLRRYAAAAEVCRN